MYEVRGEFERDIYFMPRAAARRPTADARENPRACRLSRVCGALLLGVLCKHLHIVPQL